MQPLCIHCAGRLLFHTCVIRTPSIPPQLACSPVFVRPHGMYKFKPHNSPKRDVEGAVPYNYALLCHAAKSLRSLRILPPIRGHKKAVQSFHSDTTLFYPLVCFSSIAYLHRLVGLRLLRLCLKLRNGLCPLTPQALWRRA